MTDMQAKFQEKLRKETGVDDIVIDWSSYHRTPPAYLRNYDPGVCSASAYMSSGSTPYREIYFYGSLRELCKKSNHLYVYGGGKGSIHLEVSAYKVSKIICYLNNGDAVPGYKE